MKSPLTVAKMLTTVCLVLLALTLGCAKKMEAPVPGTINTFDAYSARVIGDAQAALLGAKTWELCSDGVFPPTVTFDGQTVVCDGTAGPFPAAGRPILFKAEESYNLALAAAKAYHSGAGGDTAGLSAALTTLGVDIGNLLAGIGKGK